MDTGSNISIVRPDVIQQAPGKVKPVNSRLRTVTGETAPLLGKAEVQLKIGSSTLTREMWVAAIQDECILGLDFLEPLGCLVDLKEGILQIGAEEVALQKPTDSAVPKCYRAALETAVS